MPPEGRVFLCVGGAGPDAAVVNGVDAALKQKFGQLAYWFEGFRQLIRYEFPLIRVRSEGRTERVSIIVVGRTVNYGGPFKITTGASLFDNSFEILTNATTSRWRYLASLPALWLGKLRSIDIWNLLEDIRSDLRAGREHPRIRAIGWRACRTASAGIPHLARRALAGGSGGEERVARW